MHWILIIWFANYSTAARAPDHIEFADQAACKSAYQQMDRISESLYGVCVPDRTPPAVQNGMPNQ